MNEKNYFVFNCFIPIIKTEEGKIRLHFVACMIHKRLGTTKNNEIENRDTINLPK